MNRKPTEEEMIEYLKDMDTALDESFKTQFLYGKSAIEYDEKGKPRSLSIEEIWKKGMLGDFIEKETLTAKEILEKYDSYLTEEQKENLRNYKPIK